MENENQIILSESSIKNLYSIRKMTFGLAVFGLVFVGLMTLGFFLYLFVLSIEKEKLSAEVLPPQVQWIILIFMLFTIALEGVCLLFLLQFSSNLKKALESKELKFVDRSFNKLKLHYRAVVILIIGCIVLYTVLLVLAPFVI